MASTQEILAQIDSLFMAESIVPPVEKLHLATRLAREYWKVVFPEFGTLEYKRLTTDEKERRWAIERKKAEWTSCVNAAAVLRVVCSPTTGDNLLWIKQWHGTTKR
jgi:hypothetical protein